MSLCETLQVLEGYDLAALGFHSAAEIHVLVEALRRVCVDRNNELGDPDFIANPVAQLLAPAYAAAIRAGIDPERATPSSTLVEAARLGFTGVELKDRSPRGWGRKARGDIRLKGSGPRRALARPPRPRKRVLTPPVPPGW